MHQLRANNTTGFTVIELMVTMVIVGILASFTLGKFLDARAQARDARRLEDMEQIRAALELFRLDHNRYPDNTHDRIPTSGEIIGAGGYIDAALSKYMTEVPKDPLYDSDPTVYFYAYDSRHLIDNVNCANNTAPTGAVYGFFTAEVLTDLPKVTCAGGNMKLNSAAYNQGFVRANY